MIVHPHVQCTVHNVMYIVRTFLDCSSKPGRSQVELAHSRMTFRSYSVLLPGNGSSNESCAGRHA